MASTMASVLNADCESAVLANSHSKKTRIFPSEMRIDAQLIDGAVTPEIGCQAVAPADLAGAETRISVVDSTQVQPKRKGGAPRFNTNRLAHGRYAKQPIRWRGVAKHRRDLQDIESECGRVHSQLSERYLAVYGEVDIEAASALDVAASWHFHAALAMKHLRQTGLKPAEELEFSRDAAKAKAARHSVIQSLNLNAKPADDDPWKSIPTAVLPPVEPESPQADARGVSAADASTGLGERHGACANRFGV